MKKTTFKLKALLLALFVFPGAGQLALKRYKTALALILASIIAIAMVINNLIALMMPIVQELATNPPTQALSINEVMAIVHNSKENDPNSSGLLFLLFVFWLAGVLDCFRNSEK